MSDKQTNVNIVNHTAKSFGQNPYYISDTSAHTGLTGYAVKAVEDTVIAAVVPTNAGNTIVAETILGGDIWYFSCTSLTLTSGACWVYNHDAVE